MTIPLHIVDAFADRPFTGNPAAVCLLPAPCDAGWMQAVAQEMNLSETAFLVRRGPASFGLRWFTPAVEVPLCGHATLASAHFLWERGIVGPETSIEFETKSGQLRATRHAGDSRDDEGWIELDFPVWRFEAIAVGPEGVRGPAPVPGATPAGVSPQPTASSGDVADLAAISSALDVRPVAALRRGRDWLIELASAAEVSAVTPDMRALAAAGEMVIVTARSEGIGVDFVSRCFVPAVGIPEDPVTGSAHCVLAPFWAARLGREQLVGYQASARGGRVRVRLRGDRVGIAGRAVTVISGELAG